MTDVRISRAVPLDQLRSPATDVRDHRPQQAVEIVADSMGNPNVGQLQDILVYPDPDDLDEAPDSEGALDDLFRDGHPLRIVDGETRRLAAEHLGWATLHATIVPEEPEEQIVASIHANDARVDMTEFASARAFYEHYQETEKTLEDIADMAGYSSGYISNVFGLMESPDFLREAWRNPGHPLDTTQATDIKHLLGPSVHEQYRDAGDLSDEEARQLQQRDARTMVRNVKEYDPAPTDLRRRIKNLVGQTVDELLDDRSLQERQDDGASQEADRQERSHTPQPVPENQCMVCGNKATRKKALDVCREDYGMLAQLEDEGGTLVANAEAIPDDAEDLQQATQAPSEEHQALFDFLEDFPPNEAAAIHDELQQASQAAGEAADD